MTAHAPVRRLPIQLHAVERIAIVLPAYNEEAGLSLLLGRLRAARTLLGRPFEIIVVDDGSTDRTAAVAEVAARTLPVRLIRHGRNLGLGCAIRTGLLAAMEHHGAVVTMDADDSHDPALIPRMLNELRSGSDVVIASRFAAGGGTVGVAPHRRLLSRAARTVLTHAVGLRGVRDYSSGYRAYHTSVLRRLVERFGPEGCIEERGFASCIELLLKVGHLGARISEVPLLLRYDRKRSASKLSILATVRRYGAVLRTQRRLERAARTAHPVRRWIPLALDAEAGADASCRALNLTVALAGLLLTAPIMLVVALLIKATSPGPVLYAQTRIGRDRRNQGDSEGASRRRVHWGGEPFTIYKFRTMYYGHASADDQVWARPDDPRVTPVGRFLRRYRLDELPQLLNVLRSEMNVVGPRPEQPGIVMQLRVRVDNYDRRHAVPPGITGWAQINHPYDRSIEDVRRKVGYDLEYIARRSALEDLRIMARTVPVVLLRRGAW